MVKKPDIQFPVAALPDGTHVLIQHAPREGVYSCLECARPMMVKQGERNAWHFAHYSFDFECTPDRTMHLATQKVFQFLLTNRSGMRVSFPCENCAGGLGVASLAGRVPPNLRVELEDRTVCAPSVVDLSAYSGDRLRFVIEVVNTHYPSPDTRRRLETLPAPVFLVKTDSTTLANHWIQAVRAGDSLSFTAFEVLNSCLLYTSPSPRD